MNILVTGATGYIGSQLALKLAVMGHYVNVLVRHANSVNIPMHNHISVFKGDLNNYSSIEKAMGGCDIVMHTAAFTNLRCTDIEQFYNVNVLGTQNILELALKHKIDKVIYTSSLSVFGPAFKNNPITENQPRLNSYSNDYELTKAMSEELVRQYVDKGLNCVILNVSRVYGPGIKTFSNGVNGLIAKMVNSKLIFVPNKMMAASNYVYIDDVISAHISAIYKGTSGQNYIIGGTNVNYANLFRTIQEITNSKVKIVTVDYGLLKTIFFFINLFKTMFGLPIGVTPKMLDYLFVNRISSSAKAMKQLDYSITQLQPSLSHTIETLNLKS